MKNNYKVKIILKIEFSKMRHSLSMDLVFVVLIFNGLENRKTNDTKRNIT